MKSLKKILSYMMIIIMSVFLFSGVDFKEASADETFEFSTSKGTLYYEISNNEIVITSYLGKDTELEIPSRIDGKSVASIGKDTFLDNSRLTTIAIPDSVTSIGECVFCGCGALINVDKDNKYFSSENGILFNKDKSKLIYYPNKKSEETYTIPNSVTTISPLAFRNNWSLKSIIIPDSVQSIAEGAFSEFDNQTIYANKNSYAETYAKENSIPFKEIVSSDLLISSFTASKASPQLSGTEVILTAKATGNGTLKYKFIIKDNKTGTWAALRDYETSNTYVWKTKAIGDKTLYVDVKDESGKVIRKAINYTVTAQNLNIESFKADKASPQVSGTEVTLTAKATGTGTLQYKFLIKASNGNWYLIKDYSTSNTCKWKTGLAGNKTLYVDVKDENGKVIRKSMNYTVNEKNQETTEEKAPKAIYEGYVETYGWMNKVSNGEICGTTGKALRLEGYKLSLDTTEDLSIEYRSHVQGIGWQDYVKDGDLSGTENQSKRLEAISIKLSGSAANKYDVYYRVHCSYIGWLDWAKNGEDAGSTGQAIKVEAMQVVILPKGQKVPGSTENHFLSTPSVSYTVKLHNGNFGTTVKDGAMAGITGQGKQIEGIKINLNDMSLMSGSINYQGHIQYVGWGDTVSNGTELGVDGNRLEGIRIWLSESISVYYDVYYRVYCQNLGWLGWAKNGENAGSEGYSYRAEAIEIKLYRKDFGPETNEADSFKKKVTLTERQKMENRLKPIAESKSLYDCFAWVCQSTTYFRTYNFPKYHDWDIDYVNNYLDSYSNGQYYGNCYSYSAVFANLARLKGYDAELRCGYCSRVGGGLTEHCWVEINGLVYDPDMADARNNYSKYYGKTRAQIGLGYCKDVVY